MEKPDNAHLIPSSPARFFMLTTDMEGTLSQLEEHDVTEKVITAASYADFCARADLFTFDDFVRKDVLLRMDSVYYEFSYSILCYYFVSHI